MRTTLLTLVTAAAAITAGAAPARAKPKPDDKAVTGTYDVKYDEVSNNCTNVGMAFRRGTLAIAQKKASLTVDIERVPMMVGTHPKHGKVKAHSKLGPSSIKGLDGKFSIAGRVDNGVLQMVFVAEYYVKGKPLCTQSWNVSGLRSKTTGKAAASPAPGVAMSSAPGVGLYVPFFAE
jgi:hypothetical protein